MHKRSCNERCVVNGFGEGEALRDIDNSRRRK